MEVLITKTNIVPTHFAGILYKYVYTCKNRLIKPNFPGKCGEHIKVPGTRDASYFFAAQLGKTEK